MSDNNATNQGQDGLISVFGFFPTNQQMMEMIQQAMREPHRSALDFSAIVYDEALFIAAPDIWGIIGLVHHVIHLRIIIEFVQAWTLLLPVGWLGLLLHLIRHTSVMPAQRVEFPRCQQELYLHSSFIE